MNCRRYLILLFVGFVITCGHGYWSPAYSDDANNLSSIQEEARKGGYRLIDVDSLWKMYQDDKESLVLVDTRQEWEHHAGYIEGSLNFPFEPTWLSRLTNRGALEQFLGPDKNKTFVFY